MTPDRAVLVLGLLFGLLFALVTPPFQVPDEPLHFCRAYQVSEGDLVPERAGDAAVGVLPSSLEAVTQRYIADLPFRPASRIAPAEILDGFAVRLEPDRRHAVPVIATYTAAPYLPQALGILPGRLVGLPPLALLYLARLANLAVCLPLAWAAVRIAPFFRWLLALLVLTPMALFQRSSASPDAVTAALSWLVVATVLALAFGQPREGKQRTRLVALLLAGAAVLPLAKGAYFLLPLLAFLIPPERLGPRRWAALVLAAVLALTAAGFAASAWMARQAYAKRPGVEVDSARQSAGIVRQPLRFLAVVARDYVVHAPHYTFQSVGNFGWLDTPLPLPVAASWAALLFALALIDGSPRVAPAAWQRLWTATLFAATLLIISTTQYLVWTPVGAAVVEGLQGRYYIPVIPLFFLLFANRRLARDLSSAAWKLAAASAAVLGISLLRLASRYYGPT